MSFDAETGDFAQPAPRRLSAVSRHEASATVCDITLRQVLSARLTAPVPTRFHYGTADPFAIGVEFLPLGEEPVTWVFSRDLLLAGLRTATGRGDVRIWPVVVRGQGPTLCLAFESPAGQALFEADAEPLRRWLKRTCRMVPPGSESSWIAWDQTLEQIIGYGPED